MVLHRFRKGLRRDLAKADVATRDLGDFVHRFGKGQAARTRHFEQLADAPGIGQRRDRDIGDIIGIDKGFGYRAGGQGQFA